MGAVYLAFHRSLERKVALKVLLPASPDNSEFEKRFRREATLLANLESTNVVRFLGWGFWNNRYPYLVMELLEGMTLAQLTIDSDPLDWRRAFEIGVETCKGLEAIHQQGVIHRDLSPSNIFICQSPSPCVKIIDLGLASCAPNTGSTLTETGLLMGSIHYMSPEMCGGQKANVQSDIYSLGCILYEIISGTRAQDGDNPMGLIYRHANVYPEPLNEVAPQTPEFVQRIIFKSIQKDHATRYSSASAMRKDMEDALSGEINPTQLPPWAVNPKSFKPFDKKIIALISAIFIAIILVGYKAFAVRSVNQNFKTSHPRQSFFSLKNEGILDYLDGVRRSSLTDPATAEKTLEAWLQYKPERTRSENSLFIAHCYRDIADYYEVQQDSVNSNRVWQLFCDKVNKYHPTDPTDEQAKLLFQMEIYYRGALSCKSITASEESLKNYFAHLPEVPGLMAKSDRLSILFFRETQLACAQSQWARALKAANSCIDSAPTRYHALCAMQEIATTLPAHFRQEVFNLLERGLRYEQNPITWRHLARKGLQAGNKESVGIATTLMDEADERDEDNGNLTRLMNILEVCATHERLDMAQSWLKLYQTWFKQKSAELSKLLSLYSLDPEQRLASLEEVSKVVSTVVEKTRLNKQPLIFGEAVLNEETLRLCALYPEFTTQGHDARIISQRFIEQCTGIFAAIKVAEPINTLCSAAETFGEMPSFDAIVETFYVKNCSAVLPGQRVALCRAYAKDPRFSSIRRNLETVANKLDKHETTDK